MSELLYKSLYQFPLCFESKKITEFLFLQEDVNVIIVGWGGILDYPVAASSTRTVGSEAAFMVDTLVEHGASYE